MTVVVLVREVGVTVLRFWVIRHGVIPASRGGKVKTLLQGIGDRPVRAAAEPAGCAGVSAVVLAAAVVMTLATGVDYIVAPCGVSPCAARAESRRAERGLSR